MNIYVWNNFTKRKNSTLQPSNGTLKQVVLKEDTSISNPTFIINEPLPSYTYVSAFGNYYFVTDITNLSAKQSAISCSIDVLATYRSTILNYNAFVERSASNYDIMVNDPLLSGQQKIISSEMLSTESAWFNQRGCYVVQCFAKNGGIVLYATNDLSIYGNVLDTSTYSSTDIINWIDKKVAQAFDLDVYIGSVKWLPIGIDKIGTATRDLFVGPININVDDTDPSYVIRKSDQRTPIGIEIVTNLNFPTSNKFGDYRDYSPRFSKYRISLPGVGFVELDPLVMGDVVNHPINPQSPSGAKFIHDWMFIDYISGDIVHQLMLIEIVGSARKEIPFASYRGNIGVAIPLTKSSSDTIKGITQIGTGVASGGAVGGVVGAAIGGAIGLVGAIQNEFAPDTSFINSAGYDNMRLLQHQSLAFECIAVKYGSKEFATSVAGRPLMQNVRLGNLSGFCKCGNASVPVNARDEERDAINSYLNSGVYIE